MSCAGSCLQIRPSTALPAWPLTQAQMGSLEPWTTCPSPLLCMARVTSELSVSRPDSGPPAQITAMTHPLSPHSCPAVLRFDFFFFFVSFWPYHFCCLFLRFHPIHCSSPLCRWYPCFLCNTMQLFSRFTKREKLFCLFLIYLSLVFFRKWIK